MLLRSPADLYLLPLRLALALALALAVRVGRALLAGLDELFALEAVIAALPLLVPAGRLPLLLLLLASRLFTLPAAGKRGGVKSSGWQTERCDRLRRLDGLTSWRLRWTSCRRRSLCTPSWPCRTPSWPRRPSLPIPTTAGESSESKLWGT